MAKTSDGRATDYPKAFFGTKSDTELDRAAPRLPRTEVILDMGEASREEGFRLNGCR